MNTKKKIVLKNNQTLTEKKKKNPPRLHFEFQYDDEKNREVLKDIKLSDGSTFGTPDFLEKALEAFKKISGSDDVEVAHKIISQIAFGMSSSEAKHRYEAVTSILPNLKPSNELEALLLGQFLSLQESALKCIRNANDAEMFYHKERLFPIAVKLMRCANETIQTFLKVQSGGKQQIVIAHVHGGQAIIANEVNNGGGA